MTPWEVANIRLYLDVDGTVYPVSTFSASFALNSIPRATCQLAPGADVATGARSTIHTHAEKFAVRSPARVFVKFLSGSRMGSNLYKPGKEMTLFKGYVSGASLARSSQSVSFSVVLEHWLADLQYSTLLSSSSHPGNPGNITAPAGTVHFSFDDAGLRTGISAWTAIPPRSVNMDKAPDDLWKHAIKPWFRDLAEFDTLDRRLLRLDDKAKQGNPRVKYALDNITSKNMKMTLGLGTATTWQDMLENALVAVIGRGAENSTFWNKLIGELAPLFWFAVSPRIEDAIVAPFVGALRVSTSEVPVLDTHYVQTSPGIPQLLRAIVIAFPDTNPTGLKGAGPAQFSSFEFAAIYPVDAIENKAAKKEFTGSFIIKKPPEWFINAIPTQGAGLAEGLGGHTVATTGVIDKKNLKRTKDPQKETKDRKADAENILTKYAQHWYALEQLKLRRASVVVPFRLDIAPGSQVAVNVVGQGKDDLQMRIFGCATQVELTVNASSATANTTLQLAHVRDEQENDSDDFTVDVPPFYERGWVGAKLNDAF